MHRFTENVKNCSVLVVHAGIPSVSKDAVILTLTCSCKEQLDGQLREPLLVRETNYRRGPKLRLSYVKKIWWFLFHMYEAILDNEAKSAEDS